MQSGGPRNSPFKRQHEVPRIGRKVRRLDALSLIEPSSASWIVLSHRTLLKSLRDGPKQLVAQQFCHWRLVIERNQQFGGILHEVVGVVEPAFVSSGAQDRRECPLALRRDPHGGVQDRKSTRLNSCHA